MNSRIAGVLTLGAGGDDQNHVTRPKTAKSTQNEAAIFKRPDSKLETITERNPAEEEAVAMSQALQSGTFDIEASHSFSMRNFGKHERSNAALAVFHESHKAANGLESGKESSMSNYSRIQAESINN